MKFDSVAIQKPEAISLILGQAHFIKTVEDLHEALVTARKMLLRQLGYKL